TPGRRFSRPHWGHLTSLPANSSFSSYDVPHPQVTRTATVGSVRGSFQMYVLTSGPSWGDSARPGRRTPMRRVPALFLMLAAATTAWPQSPQATQPAAPVFIRVGRLIDGRSDAAQSGVGILIEGDRIKAVGPLAQVQGQAK